MNLEHILLYKFKEGVPEARIDEHLAFIESLRGQFEGLTALKCGRTRRPGRHGFTHGFVMTFESAEALKAYATSPAHAELVANFKDYVADKLVSDIDSFDEPST